MVVGLVKLHVSLLLNLDSSLLVAFHTRLCFSRPAEWKPYILFGCFCQISPFHLEATRKKKKTCY